jgi:hypothetical protein
METWFGRYFGVTTTVTTTNALSVEGLITCLTDQNTSMYDDHSTKLKRWDHSLFFLTPTDEYNRKKATSYAGQKLMMLRML